MRPVFFELTLWNDPQKGAKRPAEWDACRAANRSSIFVNMYFFLPTVRAEGKIIGVFECGSGR